MATCYPGCLNENKNYKESEPNTYAENCAERYPDELSEVETDEQLWVMKRRSAYVSDSCDGVGMILDPSFGDIMNDGIVIRDDNDVVNRLVQVYKQMEQADCSGLSSCPTYCHAKKVLRVLGRSLWTAIPHRM